MVRKGRVLVFRGEFSEPVTTAKVDELLQETREERFRETTVTNLKK